MIQVISKFLILTLTLTALGVNPSVAEDIKDMKNQQLGTLLETYIEEINSLKNEIKSLKSSVGFEVNNTQKDNSNCKSNPNKCAPKELCSLATFVSGGEKYWMKGLRKVYSDAAKKRNLSCGVSSTNTKLEQKEAKRKEIEEEMRADE